MTSFKRPYLIHPKIVEQSTWGGLYITNYKNWTNRKELQGKKIGQSYELYGSSYGSSLLAVDPHDSSDPSFGPESEARKKNPASYVSLSHVVEENPEQALGPCIWKTYQRMPLLIKFTQGLGNSFQLHIQPGNNDKRWKPKAESWYYFEDGYVTLGIRENVDIAAYKQTCTEINEAMQTLSQQITSGALSLDEAKSRAKKLISEKNPWQYVNVHRVRKFDLIDLSRGGLHHSWEENDQLPLGNILYEVQEDVSDDDATIRSFDQGKFKDDGTIRKLNIDDYFAYIDKDPIHNSLTNALQKPKGDRLLTTKKYCMDLLVITKELTERIDESFVHLFAREGDVDIIGAEGAVRLTKGHSCFIPYGISSYRIVPRNTSSVLIKTFIEME